MGISFLPIGASLLSILFKTLFVESKEICGFYTSSVFLFD
jgi:hypothetical protein